MQTKICTRCGVEKPLTEFNFKNKEQGKYQSQCKECQRENARKNYYQKYKYTSVERYKRNRKIHRQRVKQYLDEIRAKGCIICGENCPCCIDFHHLREKTFNLAEAKEKSRISTEEELQKCVLLCANCHRKLHAGLITLPKVPVEI